MHAEGSMESPAAPVVQADCIGPSARKERVPQDDKGSHILLAHFTVSDFMLAAPTELANESQLD